MSKKSKDVFILCDGKDDLKDLKKGGRGCRPPNCRCLTVKFNFEGASMGMTLTDPDMPNVTINVGETEPQQAFDELLKMCKKVMDKRKDLASLYNSQMEHDDRFVGSQTIKDVP